MLIVGIKMIPDRRVEGDLIESFNLQEYITEVVLLENSSSVGKAIKDAPLVREIELEIIEVIREGSPMSVPSPDLVLRTNDVLRIRCDLERLKKIMSRQGSPSQTPFKVE